MRGFIMIKEVKFEFHKHRQVFDVRDVLTKIEYLEWFFEDELKKHDNILNVVIAVPYFDSNMNVIKDKHDGVFYRQHLKIADAIADHLNENAQLNVIDIISNGQHTSEVAKKVDTTIDYVVFLDFSTGLERDFIGSQLASNTPSGKVNKKLHAIELFSLDYLQHSFYSA